MMDASSLSGSITSSLSGTGQLILTGASDLGDFTLDQNDGANKPRTHGVAGTNIGYFSSTSNGFDPFEIDLRAMGG